MGLLSFFAVIENDLDKAPIWIEWIRVARWSVVQCRADFAKHRVEHQVHQLCLYIGVHVVPDRFGDLGGHNEA